jgi:hypothetical protein
MFLKYQMYYCVLRFLGYFSRIKKCNQNIFKYTILELLGLKKALKNKSLLVRNPVIKEDSFCWCLKTFLQLKNL